MKVLFIGDIVGKIGRQAVKSLLPNLVNRYKIDAVIANGENAAGGFGITEKTAEDIFNCGVHIITTGNHVWDKKEAVQYISKENRILRPSTTRRPRIRQHHIHLPNKKKIAMNVSKGL
jgi:hypothetical protein